jgi:nucleotide-binding universal stress UspA family protein
MKKIVVGVDNSPSSHKALLWAYDEAERWGAELHIIHAWEGPSRPVARVAVTEPRDITEYDNAEILAAAMKEIPDGGKVSVHPHLYEGEPAELIRRESKDADLIVIGAHGRHGFREAMVGSVAYKLTHQAPCPVAVVRI